MQAYRLQIVVTTSISRQLAIYHGLPADQCLLLCTICELPRSNVNQLTKRTGLSKAKVVAACHALSQKRGYVREVDAGKRRGSKVFELTQAGMDAHRQILKRG